MVSTTIMNWIIRFFDKKGKKEDDKPSELEEKILNIDGSFVNEEEYEKIWIAQNINHSNGTTSSLKDDDYIGYHIWQDQNISKLYEKHLPDTIALIGKTPNILFHGGCLGCVSQRNHGIDRCKGCRYFRFSSRNPNLYIKGEHTDSIGGDDLRRKLGGE